MRNFLLKFVENFSGMKKSLATLLVAAIGFSVTAKTITNDNQLPNDAVNDIKLACDAMDLGMHDLAIQMLDSLDRIHPGTFVIPYETAHALYLKKDYNESLNRLFPIFDHPDANGDLFSIIGNCYDDKGDSSNAIKYYSMGIERFPNDGRLYVNKGICLERQQRTDEAITTFIDGINADPYMSSNYYHLARLLQDSNPAWSAIYAEEFLALCFNDLERRSQMAYLVYNPVNKLEINGKVVNLNIATEEQMKPKALMYNYTLSTALKNALPFDGADPAQISKLRKNFVELMSSKTSGNELPIIDYLKSIIDAGHWDAYASYVFTLANGEEPIGRIGPDEKKTYDFLEWLQDGHAFVPDPTKFITQRPIIVE